GEIGGQGRGVVSVALPVCDFEDLPADLLDSGSRGMVAVDDGVVGDGGDYRGDGPDVVVVPGAEQAAADQVVDLVFVRRRAGLFARRGGGNDGVMVGDLGVVDEAPS